MKLFCLIEKQTTKVMFLVALFVGLGSCFSQENNYERLKQNRENSSTWNEEMYQNDSAFHQQQKLSQFVFHTPKYELIRPFCGVGSVVFSGGEENEVEMEGKHVLYQAFYSKSCSESNNFPLFFQIVVALDEIDTVNYSHFSSTVVSRNHPDVLGSGSFTEFGKTIPYEAFHFWNGNDIAVINQRIFHLELGNLILLRVNKNGEIFTQQIDGEMMTSEIDLNDFKKLVLKHRDFLLGTDTNK